MLSISVDPKAVAELTTRSTTTHERSNLVLHLRQFYGKYFGTKCDKLKVCQMILGNTTIIVTSQLPYHFTRFSYCLVTFGFHVNRHPSVMITAILLWDTHNGNQVQKLLHLDRITDHLDLHLNGLAAAVYYVASFGVLATFYVGDYHPFAEMREAIFGILASMAHAYNWWLLFRERAARRRVNDGIKYEEDADTFIGK